MNLKKKKIIEIISSYSYCLWDMGANLILLAAMDLG